MPSKYIRKDQNLISLVIRSKGIFNFLNEAGFKPGRKKEIVPPSWIATNKVFFKNFIRGVFDTDGYLCLKNKERKKYPVLGITSKSKYLLKQIQEFIRIYKISSYLGSFKANNSKLGIRSIVHKLQISGKKNIIMFFNLIGSSNLRNQIKYKEMGRTGIEPVTPRASVVCSPTELPAP